MNIFQKYKNYIILFAIVILGFFIYSTFFSDSEIDNSLLEISGPQNVDILGEEIIRALNRIQSLTLDDKILRDPVLNSLKDLSEPIRPEPVGRQNPFEPFNASSETTIENVDVSTEPADSVEPEATQ